MNGPVDAFVNDGIMHGTQIPHEEVFRVHHDGPCVNVNGFHLLRFRVKHLRVGPGEKNLPEYGSVLPDAVGNNKVNPLVKTNFCDFLS